MANTSPKKRRARQAASGQKGGRATLKAALPDALRNAVEMYRAVAFDTAPEDTKAFQQHQAACKAALSHIEALLKLCDAAGAEPVGEADGAGDAQAMLARAEAAYRRYAKGEDTDDAEDTSDD